MARKPIENIWKPTEYVTEIGATEYTISPQPIERIIEFDETVQALTSTFQSMTTKYFVQEDGEDIHGPFDSQEEAEKNLNGTGTSIRVESPTMRQLLEQVVGAPYPALKALVPDLKEEDVRAAPLPQLKHVLALIIEVNGVEWFESFLKNSIGPLLPEILKAGLEGIKETLGTNQRAGSGEAV